MCFSDGDGSDPQAQKSRDIERQLREDEKRLAREVKILLLGAGESGKSTVLKQMRLIHHKTFTVAERKQWKAAIFQNLLHAFHVIFDALTEQDLEFADHGNVRFAEVVAAQPDISIEDAMPMSCLGAFKSLWADENVQLAVHKGNEYALHDNLSYFFADIDRLFAKDFLPTDQDILRARQRTTGISETIFETDSYIYRMFDVGGQRSERKKWVHVFDGVNVILFLVAISGYDHVLIEDRTGNQMKDALALFESIVNSKYFERSALILFLNKMDLFRNKVLSGASPIHQFFPDFTGSDKDVEAGQTFFAHKFRSAVRSPDKHLYVHYTNATDTNLLDKTMKSVQDLIVQRNLTNLLM